MTSINTPIHKIYQNKTGGNYILLWFRNFLPYFSAYIRCLYFFIVIPLCRLQQSLYLIIKTIFMSKKIILVILPLVLSIFAFSQTDTTKSKKPEDMIRRYWFVLLTKGNNRDQDSATAAKKIGRAHV